MGVNRALVRDYLGHAQGDVLGEHYEQISRRQLAESVIPAIEKWLNKGDASENLPPASLSDSAT
jgi:hypothetical protein